MGGRTSNRGARRAGADWFPQNIWGTCHPVLWLGNLFITHVGNNPCSKAVVLKCDYTSQLPRECPKGRDSSGFTVHTWIRIPRRDIQESAFLPSSPSDTYAARPFTSLNNYFYRTFHRQKSICLTRNIIHLSPAVNLIYISGHPLKQRHALKKKSP